MMKDISGRWQQLERLIARFFPERQIFLRSQGRVRFLTIPGFVQMALSALLLIVVSWQLVTTFQYFLQGETLEEKSRALADMNRSYRSLSKDVSMLEKEILYRTEQLERRQKFLEEIVLHYAPENASDAKTGSTAQAPSASQNSHATGKEKTSDPIPDEASDASDMRSSMKEVSNSSHTAVDIPPLYNSSNLETRLTMLISTLEKIHAVQAQTLSLLEPIQTKESRRMENLFASLGFSFKAVSKEIAGPSGGPFDPVTKIDPIFSLQDHEAFEHSLARFSDHQLALSFVNSLPVGKPAADYYISSRYGNRRDPIKGVTARHPGIDLAAWRGTAVQAAAQGEVVFAGWHGPYGNMIDIKHDNGFKTRYGHMQKLRVKKGDRVERGDRIGDVGDTGRTTGTHLHFEVWLNDQLQNPLPYLQARKAVLAIEKDYKNRLADLSGKETASGAGSR